MTSRSPSSICFGEPGRFYPLSWLPLWCVLSFRDRTISLNIYKSAFIGVSIYLTKYRSKLRKQMVERDVISRGIHADVLLNYESIKYFSTEDFERRRYGNAVGAYQDIESQYMSALNSLSMAQNLITV